MKHSEQLNELGAALAKAQAMIRGALKDASNPFFKSKYADLESCWDAVRNPLSINGLSVIQTLDEVPDGIAIETMLLHSSGQHVIGRIKLKPTKEDPQGYGSAISYGRRYSLAAIVGLTQVDDDANHASGLVANKVESHAPKIEKVEPKTDSIKKDTPVFNRAEAVKSIRAFLVDQKIDEGQVLQMLEDKKLVNKGTVRLDDCPVDIIQKIGSDAGRERLKSNFNNKTK